MGLRETIQGAVGKAFVALGNVAETVTYTSVSAATYDATTGSIATTKTAHAGMSAVFQNYNKREIDGDAIRPHDLNALLSKVFLPVVPSVNDTITRSDGTVWAVMNVETDPANAHWSLQVRRP